MHTQQRTFWAHLKTVTVKLHVDPDAASCFFKPRVESYAMKSKVEEELECLQALGIIELVHFSRWAAPIVLVLKPNGTARICGDDKLTVKQVSKLEGYSLPRVDDLFATLAGGKLFTKLDMSHTYQHTSSIGEIKRIHHDKYTERIIQVQLSSVWSGIQSRHFQRTMDTLLHGISQVAVYLDDILITGANETRHTENLKQVLERLSDAGLRLKREKCVCSSVTYLGHKITAVEDKVRTIKEAPSPKNVTELRSFLGIVNYMESSCRAFQRCTTVQAAAQ